MLVMSILKVFSICFILVAVLFTRTATGFILKTDKYSVSMLEESSDEEEPIEEQDTSEEIESEWKDDINENSFFHNQLDYQKQSSVLYKNSIIVNLQHAYLSPILSQIVPPPDNLI